MAMGYHAAFNIHQKLLSQLNGKEAKPMHFPEVPPMIAIAIGKNAIMLSPVDGTTSGEAVLEMMFRDDLGFASRLDSVMFLESPVNQCVVCWEYLQLGIDPALQVETELLSEKGKDLEAEADAIDTLDTTCARMEAITV